MLFWLNLVPKWKGLRISHILVSECILWLGKKIFKPKVLSFFKEIEWQELALEATDDLSNWWNGLTEQGKGIEIERLDKIVPVRGLALGSRGAPENFRGPGPKIRGGRGPPGPPCCAPPGINAQTQCRVLILFWPNTKLTSLFMHMPLIQHQRVAV